jgi:membrane protein implicated in regulation of membrane protease activity
MITERTARCWAWELVVLAFAGGALLAGAIVEWDYEGWPEMMLLLGFLVVAITFTLLWNRGPRRVDPESRE